MARLPLDEYLWRERAALLIRCLRLEQECERLRQELEQEQERAEAWKRRALKQEAA